MKESDFNGRATAAIRAACRGLVAYKHADGFTSGIPDSSYHWHNLSTWIEYKLLKTNESIHDQLAPVQLVELMALERELGRAWVVAGRRGRNTSTEYTEIYRPSKLFGGAVPRFTELANEHTILQRLKQDGVAKLAGYNYAAIAKLIILTHNGGTL